MSYFDHPLFDILSDTLPLPFSDDLRKRRASNDVLGLVTQSVDRSKAVTFTEVFYKEFFRKVDDAPLDIDTASVALNSFLDVELENSTTNRNIRDLTLFIKEHPFSPIAVFIRRVQAQICVIVDPIRDRRIEPGITFGATVNLSSNNTVFGRFNNPTATVSCLEYLRKNKYIRSDYNMMDFPRSANPPSPFGALDDDFSIVQGSNAETVPKTALTDRFLATEPVVNLAYQRGVGLLIDDALCQFGLDKSKSADYHKILAKEASINGLLSTVDLSAASDRITVELVRLLLPDWLFEMLAALRSDNIKVGDKYSKLQMFSTAGNGFTFELETLIFYSMALISTATKPYVDVYSSAPPYVSTYGDDIILPRRYYKTLTKIFTLVGFKVNTKKSFSRGKFRESCGGDYYDGNDVRGFNAKRLPRTPDAWIGMCNAIRRVCYYNNSNTWRFKWCEDLWIGLSNSVPESKRLYGPKHYGDSCINTEDESLYTIKSKRWTGEYLKIRATCGEEYTSVGREIHENRTRGDLAVRLVTHASLVSHGLRETSDGLKYPYSLLTSVKTQRRENRWVPYTLYGQAPTDIDELFDNVISVNAHHLLDSRQVIARAIQRDIDNMRELEVQKELKLQNITKLADTLVALHAKRGAESAKVAELYQNFTL